ncbi:signal peptide peptidase SppA [Ignavibacteria bacterium CHB1]|mgnify:CR=1 FL=1|nr:MAG: signal peptide peptidase SppA [Chlorobiota bacterium]MBV6398677.1 hypothetical protein [Ignavibacteria bacterium]MCC6885155.1 signal peptide peptidase SppA [Ignavibacteriales bacterium]MCE7952055.1 signal peptide peptidase SppA [Chlorobi bacterium CHB7]MDL1886387.1 signal peptide peptidase SppA [Ignavibacteria bacterium CHB1]RIK48832.1 MAG: signal peptide peptidase SppA [Ignavibacteriota bacterium]
MENPPHRKNSGWNWFWGITAVIFLIVLLFIGAGIFFFASSVSNISSDGNRDFYFEYYGSGKGKIGFVELNYPIYSSEDIVRQFNKFRKDESIKAILLRIDSPGGGVAASQEIYEIIKTTRDNGKPVIVSFGSIAASGGYLAACGGSLIVSNPGSITGSIGVIANFVSWKELTDKIGIKDNTIKSGELKDAGNPFREMNQSDSLYFQDIVNNSFEQFFNVVKSERKIPEEKLRRIANGRVFTGQQALELGLVDKLGTLQDAVKIAAEMGGIEGEPVIVIEKRELSVFEKILDLRSDNDLNEISKYLKQEFIEAPILQYKFER